MEWYERIKELRTAKSMTQGELAQLAGYGDRSSIAKIEKGHVDIPQSKLELFASIFNVTPGYLLGQEHIEGDDMKKVSDNTYQLEDDEVKVLIEYSGLSDKSKAQLMDFMLILKRAEKQPE